MGAGLQTRIYVFEQSMPLNMVERLKDACMFLERKTAHEDGRRTFNLNPGYLSEDGMHLLTHKPNSERGRWRLSRYWVEQQYSCDENGNYRITDNTFSEYLGERLRLFQELKP
jgi:hypothetical protein